MLRIPSTEHVSNGEGIETMTIDRTIIINIEVSETRNEEGRLGRFETHRID